MPCAREGKTKVYFREGRDGSGVESQHASYSSVLTKLCCKLPVCMSEAPCTLQSLGQVGQGLAVCPQYPVQFLRLSGNKVFTEFYYQVLNLFQL